MDDDPAMHAMAALSHPTRLAAFRRLVDRLPAGLPSGELAAAIECSPTSMSAHLAVLQHAGLVRSERRGRSIVYSADAKPVLALERFLSKVRAAA